MKKRNINVDDAYALKTPEDSKRLYADWAEIYDADFVSRRGYVYHQRVAEQLIRRRADISGAILDVGCGTGVVGVVLRAAGIRPVDGVDISPQMLAESRNKRAADGSPVYRDLIEADLTRPLNIPDRQYAALISAGTFTHGHLGPDSLDELWRIAKPGAPCAIGITASHFEALGFAEKLADDVAAGRITRPNLMPVDIYSGNSIDPEHANDQAIVVVCQSVG